MKSRLDRALALRDHAIRIVCAVGQVIMIGDKRHTVFDAAPWRIVLTSPFGATPARLDPPKELGAYQGAVPLHLRRGRANLDYSLSIWRGQKVLLVEWDAATPTDLDVPNFKQSDWESEFLTWATRP
jgi:hypothetical protein